MKIVVRRMLVLVCAAAVSMAVAARPLPPEVEAALRRAEVPPEALVTVVQEVGASRARLAWQADLSLNPASLTKLLTTYAALDLLGPAYVWTTPVWLQGRITDGVLDGNLVIQGRGDPTLVIERLWLMLRHVQQFGVREIRGDIVLDRSAFAVPEQNPADFDGDALRPYNVGADALLLNYKTVMLSFTPDAGRGIAVIGVEPPLAGQRVDISVPLGAGPCNDWRATLKADFTDPQRLHFGGTFPAACGEKVWPVAHGDPKRYNEQALLGMWRDIGGRIGGSVRDGAAPSLPPTFEISSPPLAEVVRDINKFSNNTMAQQLFLTLGLVQGGAGTPEAARDVLRRWLAARLGTDPGAVAIDNGSGLSRDTRISAALFARLLQSAWASPVMPELVSSLPVAGTDGTLKRSRAATGRAHLKTGSLRDVVGVAGYVLGASGRRVVVVAMINHPNANAARPVLDAIVQWVDDHESASAAPQGTSH